MSAAAHVAERTLARTVGTATAHARDTRHSAPGAPRLGRGLVAGVHVDCVRLPVVLGDLVVDGGHDVGADGRLVHGGEGQGHARRLGLLTVDGDDGAGRGQRLWI